MWQESLLSALSAQRLTASRQQSVGVVVFKDEEYIFTCSTPYGITATISPAIQRDRPSPLLVLNALRHHGNNQNSTFPLASRLSCAQRLTASRQQSGHSPECDEPDSQCSTPYGITATIRRRPGTFSSQTSGVLNALRHHGNNQVEHGAQYNTAVRMCSTPYGITATISGNNGAPDKVAELCSTPYGITATISLVYPLQRPSTRGG